MTFENLPNPEAAQGAYFDWITANALLPAVHPNTNFTGIQKIDRTTVTDIATIGANLTAIQLKMDDGDNGNNPLGLANAGVKLSKVYAAPTLGPDAHPVSVAVFEVP